MTVLFATLASVLLLSLMVGSTSAGAGGLSHSSARPIERVSVAVSGVLLACVAALRWGVGTDYENYAVGFPNYVAESLSLSGEPGFKLLARAARLISDDYASMFALASDLRK